MTQGCYDVSLQPDDKLVVTANDQLGDVQYATFIRRLPNGGQDTGFGTDGALDISAFGTPTRVVVTPDGNLVTGLVIQDPTNGVPTSYVIELASQIVVSSNVALASVGGGGVGVEQLQRGVPGDRGQRQSAERGHLGQWRGLERCHAQSVCRRLGADQFRWQQERSTGWSSIRCRTTMPVRSSRPIPDLRAVRDQRLHRAGLGW